MTDAAITNRHDALPKVALIAIVAGLAAMYVPVYLWAFSDIWKTDEHGHGPIILAVVVWLFWRQREAIMSADDRPAWVAGAVCFALGLAIYIVGRVLSVSIFQFLSQIPVVIGLLLMLKGWPAVRAGWFAVGYLVFMIPLPGILVDAITGRLKQWVSVIAEEILYAAGYPVGRTGVILTVGPYQLLVADACSGLNSMFSLAALGLLYCYMLARKSVVHNAIMIVSIIPIAFLANIVRVMVLVLITYHMGDEAAQGFLHGFAGMLLMMVALTIFFLLDQLLVKILR